jgi:hypothetical protein
VCAERLPWVCRVAALVGVVAAFSARGADPADVAPTADAAQCPAPVPGTLTLDTVPWTSVSVDGVRVGTTPLFRAELPAGPHTLTLQNEGRGIAVVEEVVIEEGRHHKLKLLLATDEKETLLASARPEDAGDLACLHEHDLAFISVVTMPWSRVWIDGHLVGMTPLFQQKVRAGAHALRFKGPGGEIVSTRVLVEAGEVLKVALPLPAPADDGLIGH